MLNEQNMKRYISLSQIKMNNLILYSIILNSIYGELLHLSLCSLNLSTALWDDQFPFVFLDQESDH